MNVLQAHRRIAQQLVDLVTKDVPGWSNPTPISMTVDLVSASPLSSY